MEVPPKSDAVSSSSDAANGESAEAKRRPRTRSRLYRTTKGVKAISASDVAEREIPAAKPAPVAAAVPEAPPAQPAAHDDGPPQQGGEGGNYDEGGGH